MNLKNFLLSTSRRNKKLIILTSDFLIIFFATFVSLYFSESEFISFTPIDYARLLWLPLFTLTCFWFLGVYSTVVRYIDISVFYVLSKAILIATFLNLLLKEAFNFVGRFLMYDFNSSLISFEGWIVGFFTFAILLISSRLLAHFYLTDKSYEKKVIIYGAGAAGIQLSNALKVSKEMQPIAFIDKNPALHDTSLGGVRVLNPKKLEKLVLRRKVDEVLIAMPSASKSTLKSLLKEIEDLSVKVRILPGFAELAQGKVSVSELKEVDISDLLGRSEVEANLALLKRNIEHKSVLITGAGGSIGSEISRQVSKNNPKNIILLDNHEYALFSIKNEIEKTYPNIKVFSVLANVTNKERLLKILNTFMVQTVYHAAAYKHVSLVEENPFEAVTNNIFGTKICAEAACEANVDTFVLISTDKAVRPTNIMGATKRFAELILQSMSQEVATRMTMVRFGNVIGSSGSAIPLFQRQIKEGGPVTVTHPEVMRYFMTIPEASELVLQAGAMGKGGDVFLLDMGEPVKIFDLAKRLIKLSGMELIDENNPNGDIEIIFTGLKTGEKLYEELLIGDKVSQTEHQRIFRAEEDYLPNYELENYLESIEAAAEREDTKGLKVILEKAISGFVPEEAIVDVLYLQEN